MQRERYLFRHGGYPDHYQPKNSQELIQLPDPESYNETKSIILPDIVEVLAGHITNGNALLAVDIAKTQRLVPVDRLSSEINRDTNTRKWGTGELAIVQRIDRVCEQRVADLGDFIIGAIREDIGFAEDIYIHQTVASRYGIDRYLQEANADVLSFMRDMIDRTNGGHL